MARIRYEMEYDFRLVLGVRLPSWLALAFTEDDGTTPLPVTGHEFALTLQLDSDPTVMFALTADMTDAATGHVSWELDTNVAEAQAGTWNYSVVWVQGPDPDTDPIDVSVGGQVVLQPNPTAVPA